MTQLALCRDHDLKCAKVGPEPGAAARQKVAHDGIVGRGQLFLDGAEQRRASLGDLGVARHVALVRAEQKVLLGSAGFQQLAVQREDQALDLCSAVGDSFLPRQQRSCCEVDACKRHDADHPQKAQRPDELPDV